MHRDEQVIRPAANRASDKSEKHQRRVRIVGKKGTRKRSEGEAIKKELKKQKLEEEKKRTEIVSAAEVKSGDEIFKDEIAKLKQQLAAALAGQGT